jgi:hypothetical protein
MIMNIHLSSLLREVSVFCVFHSVNVALELSATSADTGESLCTIFPAYSIYTSSCWKLQALAAASFLCLIFLIVTFVFLTELSPCCHRQLFCLFVGYLLPLSSLLLDTTIVQATLLFLACI